jgi:Protein of unknown function (DUF2510)
MRALCRGEIMPSDAANGPLGPPPGWYPDPGGLQVLRWWDGVRWGPPTRSLPGIKQEPRPPDPDASASASAGYGTFQHEDAGRHRQQSGTQDSTAYPPGLASGPDSAPSPAAKPQQPPGPYGPQEPQDPYQPQGWPQQQAYASERRPHAHRTRRRLRNRKAPRVLTGLAMLIAIIVAISMATSRSSSSAGNAVQLSPIVKRIEALDNAYDNAHPGLAACEGSVDATLIESYLLIQKGLSGIPPGYIISSGHVITDPNPVTRKVYSYFYYQLGDYVAVHGTSADTLAAVTGGLGSGYVIRQGELRLITTRLSDACLVTLKGGSYPVIVPYPTPSPEVTGPPGCPGSAALMAAWQAAPEEAATRISGFNDISCWQGWVVASPITNANGMVAFSSRGGLHLLSSAEMQQFDSAVCSSPNAPADWSGPAGPANCS